MSSLLSTIGQRLSKSDEAPLVRVSRSFPIFGSRSLIVYAPKGKGHGFFNLPLRQLENAFVSVEAEGEKFAVKASTVTHAPIVVVDTLDEAQAIVRRLTQVLSPSRAKWFWIAAIVGLAYVVLTTPVSPPSAQRAQMQSYTAPSSSTPRYAPQIVTPQGVRPQAPAAAPQAPVATPDMNDPFGLKVAPKP